MLLLFVKKTFSKINLETKFLRFINLLFGKNRLKKGFLILNRINNTFEI